MGLAEETMALQAYLEGRRAARVDREVDVEVAEQIEQDTAKAQRAVEVEWLNGQVAL